MKTPFTPGEMARRRLELLRLWRVQNRLMLDLQSRALARELGDRGVVPMFGDVDVAQSLATATGIEIYVIHGGKSTRPRVCPQLIRGPDGGGGRAA